MRTAATKLSSNDLALYFALTLRRLGQLWRRAERGAPEAWVSFADRIGPELLPEAVRTSELGRLATGLAGADAQNRNVSGLQAVTIWADALAAGYGYTPGEPLELESQRGLTESLPAAAVPAELGAALLHADQAPLYWPLVPQPERPEPVEGQALPRPAGETDNASLYQRLFKQSQAKLAALPAEEAGLLAGLHDILFELRHVPVELANGRLVGLREHVLAATSLASALARAVKDKLDDGASTWVEAKTPYWLLAALHLEPVPALTAEATLSEHFAQAERAEEHLQAVSERLAAVLEQPSLEAQQLAWLAPGRVLLVLPATATESLNRALETVRAELHGKAALGLSGVPVYAAALTGSEASVAAQAAQAAREARLTAEQGGPASTDYAACFGGDNGALSPGLAPDETEATSRDSAGGAPGAPSGTDTRDGEALSVALLRPATTDPVPLDQAKPTRSELSVPTWQGLALAEFAAGLGQAGEVAERIQAALAYVPSIRVQALPDRVWVAGEIAALPTWVERAVELHLLWWGNRPPFALSGALCSGTSTGPAFVAWHAAAASTRPLPAHAADVRKRQADLSLPESLRGASVSFFPRFAADPRALVPLEDLRVVLGLATHILGLAGTRREEASGRVIRVGRGDGTVALVCAEAARDALPEPVAGAVAHEPGDPAWRARLTYRLMRLLGQRRQYSRKRKALPNPVDQLVEVVRSNRWEAFHRPTVREAALYLDLAARWVHSVLPGAVEQEEATTT